MGSITSIKNTLGKINDKISNGTQGEHKQLWRIGGIALVILGILAIGATCYMISVCPHLPDYLSTFSYAKVVGICIGVGTATGGFFSLAIISLFYGSKIIHAVRRYRAPTASVSPYQL